MCEFFSIFSYHQGMDTRSFNAFPPSSKPYDLIASVSA